MNPRHPASLFPLLWLAAPLFAQGAEVDLRLVAKKEASVWLVQEVKESQIVDAPQGQMEAEKTIVHTLNLTVKEVDDKGTATIATKIARIHGSMSMPPLGDAEFDSLDASEEADEGDMVASMAKAMMAGAGKTFTVKVDHNGHVTEMLADAKELIEASKGGGTMGGSSLNEGALKQLVEGAFGVRPEKPMTAGATWQQAKKEGGSQLPTENKVEMTLSKVDADSFEVTAKGTVEKAAATDDATPAEGDEDGMAAMQRQMMKGMKVSNGKVSGTQRISRQDGFVLEATKSMSMDIEMTTPVGNANIEAKVTISTKRTTEDAAKPKKAEPKPAEPAKEEQKEAPKEAPK